MVGFSWVCIAVPVEALDAAAGPDGPSEVETKASGHGALRGIVATCRSYPEVTIWAISIVSSDALQY